MSAPVMPQEKWSFVPASTRHNRVRFKAGLGSLRFDPRSALALSVPRSPSQTPWR